MISSDGGQLLQGISAEGEKRYEILADIHAPAGTAQVFAIDTCTGDRYEATNTSSSRGFVSLNVELAASCGTLQVGVKNIGTAQDVSVYSLGMDDGFILATDDRVEITGDWILFSNAEALGGYHLVNNPPIAGPSVKVTFTGSRAIMWGGIDTNLGRGSVFIDGVKVGEINFYSPTLQIGIPLFDSGPLTPGEHTFELVSDGGHVVFNALYTHDDSPVITSGALPDGQVGEAYSATVTATGEGPLTFSATGLPAGVSIDGTTGVISGTPTTAGDSTATVTVTNDLGEDSEEYEITIEAAEPVMTTIEITPSATTVNKGGSLTFTVVAVDQYGDELGDITDDVVITSSVATDVIDGNTVTFPTASPHTITARHVESGLTAQVVVQVSAGTPTVPGTGGTNTAGTSLAGTGVDDGPALLAASALLLMLGLGLAVMSRMRRKEAAE